MNIIYSILLLFSRYSLLFVQFLPPLSPHSQVDAALSFASEVWWRRKWVQPRGLIQNPGRLSKVWFRVTLKLKWPWNLIEGISAPEIFCNTHGTISCKDFGMPENHNTHPGLLKVFICNTVMTGQGFLVQSPWGVEKGHLGAWSCWQATPQLSTHLVRKPTAFLTLAFPSQEGKPASRWGGKSAPPHRCAQRPYIPGQSCLP